VKRGPELGHALGEDPVLLSIGAGAQRPASRTLSGRTLLRPALAAAPARSNEVAYGLPGNRQSPDTEAR
jgi:hypothetical protein